MNMRIVDGPVDTGNVMAGLDDGGCGAVVVFEGRVRDHSEGRDVSGLEYEAYEPLAVSEGEAVIEAAMNRWPISAARCVHGQGPMRIGDIAVVVAVIAAHRGEAFEAARFIIDEIKTRLPIWKKEHYLDGDSEWVNCRQCAVADA